MPEAHAVDERPGDVGPHGCPDTDRHDRRGEPGEPASHPRVGHLQGELPRASEVGHVVNHRVAEVGRTRRRVALPVEFKRRDEIAVDALLLFDGQRNVDVGLLDLEPRPHPPPICSHEHREGHQQQEAAGKTPRRKHPVDEKHHGQRYDQRDAEPREPGRRPHELAAAAHPHDPPAELGQPVGPGPRGRHDDRVAHG